MQVKVDRSVFRRLISFASAVDSEIGGICYGKRTNDVFEVYGTYFPKQLISSLGYCRIDSAVVMDVRRVLDNVSNRVKPSFTPVIGAWIHTHPSLGLFLSGTDQQTLESWCAFDKKGVAIVVDPFSTDKIAAFDKDMIRISCDLFQPKLTPNDDFYLTEVETDLAIFSTHDNRKNLLNVKHTKNRSSNPLEVYELGDSEIKLVASLDDLEVIRGNQTIDFLDLLRNIGKRLVICRLYHKFGINTIKIIDGYDHPKPGEINLSRQWLQIEPSFAFGRAIFHLIYQKLNFEEKNRWLEIVRKSNRKPTERFAEDLLLEDFTNFFVATALPSLDLVRFMATL